MAALCRDCFTWTGTGAGPEDQTNAPCPSCRSRRIIAHPELEHLGIGHVDCDAFYAAVEKRDDPSLTDKPLIIGGGRRGVVSTACYIARLYGVRSAMPMFKALKACPDAVVLKPDMEKYVAAGRAIRALMEDLTPLVQPLSIDEAFLDLTGTERLHGAPPAETLARLASRVETEVGVTVSVGLAPNKFLAKVASDLDKPRGFAVIGRAETLGFLADQPVTVIWGVGPAFTKALAKDGITHIRHVQKLEETQMLRRYGSMGGHVWRLSHGIDARVVEPREAAKSISSETTFNEDIADEATLRARLWPLCEKVAARAKEKGVTGQVVTLKLKTADFRTRTRRRSLERATQMAHVIFETARQMLSLETDGTRFRLLGVGISTLHDDDPAGIADLLDDTDHRRTSRERAMDSLREKFGRDAVQLGRGLRPTRDRES